MGKERKEWQVNTKRTGQSQETTGRRVEAGRLGKDGKGDLTSEESELS